VVVALIVIACIIFVAIISYLGRNLIVAAYTQARVADIERRKIKAIIDIRDEGEAARDEIRRASWNDPGW
jgi:hypothetical protein